MRKPFNFREHRDFGTKIEKLLKNFSEDFFFRDHLDFRYEMRKFLAECK